MRPSHRAVSLAALSAALVAGPILSARATPGATVVTQTAVSEPPVGSTDRNGDRVADDLAALLAKTKATAPVTVLVRGLDAATAQRRVGRFAVRRDYATAIGFAATMTEAQVRALARDDTVVRVDTDHIVFAQQAPDAAKPGGVGSAPARPEVGTPKAKSSPGPSPGPSPGLCVLDTGVDSRHEAFDGRALSFVDLVNREGVAYDDQGHGTHLTGVVAYLAPKSPLFVAKVLDAFGEGHESTVLAGLDWCLAQPGVRVVLAAFGGPGGDGNSMLEQAVHAAAERGVTVVAAAGNSGDQPGSVTSPGSAADALTVGAVAGLPAPDSPDLLRESSGIYLAPFSSRGPTPGGLTKPDVVAAGVDVLGPQAGTPDEYLQLSGTSTAAARIAGALAAALDQEPDRNVRQLRAAIVAAAADRGPAGPDSDWGAGLTGPAQVADAVTGRARPAPGPAHTRLTTTVAAGGAADLRIQVPEDPAGPQPLAVTLIVAGASKTGSPPATLDVELYDPEGVLVAESVCPIYGDVTCESGRQQTVGVPEAKPGTWTLRVLEAGGTPAGGPGVGFDAEVHRGSLPPTGDTVISAP